MKRYHHDFCRNAIARCRESVRGTLWAAEIGVASGENSAEMLKAFPDLHLLMIDPWSGNADYLQSLPRKGAWAELLKDVDGLLREQQKWYETAVRNTEFASTRRVVIRMPSVEAATIIPDGLLSFVFIDGDHRQQSVDADMRAYWPKVRPGGIFAGHDYGTRGHISVGLAVNQWFAETGLQFQVLGRCWYHDKV